MKAIVTVMPKPGVLDPQGAAIARALETLGFSGFGAVRTGKVIELELAGVDRAGAEKTATAMAERFLANPVIESFQVAIA